MENKMSSKRFDKALLKFDSESNVSLAEDGSNISGALCLYDPLRAVQEAAWATEMREAMEACGNSTATYWIDVSYTINQYPTGQMPSSYSASRSTQSPARIEPILRRKFGATTGYMNNGPYLDVNHEGCFPRRKDQNLDGRFIVNIKTSDGSSVPLVISSQVEGHMAIPCPHCDLEHPVDLAELLVKFLQVHASQEPDSAPGNRMAQESTNASLGYLAPSLSPPNPSSSRNVSQVSQRRHSPARRMPGAYPSSDDDSSPSSDWATTVDGDTSLSNSSWITVADGDSSLSAANVRFGLTCNVLNIFICRGG